MKSSVYMVGSLCILFSSIYPLETLRAETITKQEVFNLEEVDVQILQQAWRVMDENGKEIPIGYLSDKKGCVYSFPLYDMQEEKIVFADLKEPEQTVINQLCDLMHVVENGYQGDEWYQSIQLMVWEMAGVAFRFEDVQEQQCYEQCKKEIATEMEKAKPVRNQETMLLYKKRFINDSGMSTSLTITPQTMEAVEVKQDENGIWLKALRNQNKMESFLCSWEEDYRMPILYQKEGRIEYIVGKVSNQKMVNVMIQPYGILNLKVNQKQAQSIISDASNAVFQYQSVEVVPEANIYAKQDIYDELGNLVYRKEELVATINEKSKPVELLLGDYYVVFLAHGRQEARYEVTINASDSIEEITLLHHRSLNNASVLVERFWEGHKQWEKLGKEECRYSLYAKKNIKNEVGQVIAYANQKIKSFSFEADGEFFSMEDLLPGQYYLKEEQQESHYEADDCIYDFVLEEGSHIKLELQPAKLKRHTLNIQSLDKEEQPVMASFGLYNENKELIEMGSVDENGNYSVDGLIEGEYYVKQESVEKGYRLDCTMHKVMVKEEEKYQAIQQKTKKQTIEKETSKIVTKDHSNHRQLELSMVFSLGWIYYFFMKRFWK